jgi:hypothetical protein
LYALYYLHLPKLKHLLLAIRLFFKVTNCDLKELNTQFFAKPNSYSTAEVLATPVRTPARAVRTGLAGNDAAMKNYCRYQHFFQTAVYLG